MSVVIEDLLVHTDKRDARFDQTPRNQETRPRQAAAVSFTCRVGLTDKSNASRVRPEVSSE